MTNHMPDVIVEKAYPLPEVMVENANHVPKVIGENVNHVPEVTVENANHVPDVIVENVDHTPVPDGGYGWFIVLGSLLAHFVTGGLERSRGVLFLEIQKEFGGSAAMIAWVLSTSSTLRLCGGPLASLLVKWFTCRAVVIGGGLLAVISFVICSFAPSLEFLFFGFSLIGGLSRLFIYAPSAVIVGFYFDKRRALATGLSTAGVGIGTFAIPPLIQLAFSHYGYFGANYVMASVALQACVAGALFRPLEKYRNMSRKQRKTEGGLVNDQHETQILLSESKERSPPDACRGTSLFDAKESDKYDARSQIDSPDTHCQQQVIANGHEDRHEVLLSHSKLNAETIGLCQGRSSIEHEKVVQPQHDIPDSGDRKKKNCKGNLDIFNFSLLSDPLFASFCFAIGLYTLAFQSGIVFLPALAVTRGLTETEAALLLSIMGICDTTGRIVTGFLYDTTRIKPHRMLIYNANQYVLGSLSFICPLLTTFVQFAVVFGIYGFLVGAFVGQKAVMVVDILGVDKLVKTFGLILWFQGIGNLIGPPVSGGLRDNTGRYDEGFYFGGVAILVSGLILTSGIIYRKTQDRKLVGLCIERNGNGIQVKTANAYR